MKILDAVHRIKGVPGTKVMLGIVRDGSAPRNVTLQRAQITPVNIRDRIIDGAGYVTIRSFSERTAESLEEALARFEAQKVSGVILDLRENPGGLLNEATRVSDLFLPSGRLIVSTEGRDPTQRAKYYSAGKRYTANMPLVVLTNEHSASASEIVSGALKDWGRAVIAGRRTFGKASVQSIQPISRDRSQALRITVAHYYTPRHSEIQEVGIEPDVELPPIRYPSVLWRLRDDGTFNRFAGEVAGSATAWLDPAALKEGLVAASDKELGPDRVDERLAKDFRRFCETRGPDVSADEWETVRDLSVQQVRIAVMRRVKGEEAARRYTIEFDPQVKFSVRLLKLAAGTAAL
jgi:hypothetical protein